MSELLPKLERITVDPQKLYLDPNNPRFITRDNDRYDDSQFLDQDVISKTRDRMLGTHSGSTSKDEFKIEEIKQSILSNGWNPVDSIFVRRFHEDEERYVVLEGNRRVTAIREILDSADTPTDVKTELSEIEVMEVLDKVAKGKNRDKSLREIEKKISYLLGVRHHGSLKKWSPFAQASSIYEKYLRIAEQDESLFLWLEKLGVKIANTLTMQVKDVEERIRTYRCMKQIGNHPKVKAGESEGGGIKDRHYSLVNEVLKRNNTALGDYISQDSEHFQLDETSLQRIVDLCQFECAGIDRGGSPINNPQQWRFLGEILADEIEAKERNLKLVEEERFRPEDVWAKRVEEITKPEWGSWLDAVSRLFQDLPFQKFDPTDDEQIEVMSRLVSVVESLNAKDHSEQ